MPFLNPRLISFLCEQAEGCDLVIPRTPAGLQPLHAVYAKSALPAVAKQLRSRRPSLCALARQVRAKIIEPEALAPYDPGGLSCLNLNTPAEYARARACRERLTHVIDLPRRFGYRDGKLGDDRNGR
jgi:molybdopterin-guanine dinucleotide biosynthesis protein A